MRHANARDLQRRRQLLLALLGLTLLGTAPLSALAAEKGEGEGAAAKGGEKPEKKKKKQGEGEPIPEPPINSPQLIVEAVTAPVLPSGTVIMTLTVDCGTVENARAVNAMMPRVYNAVIMELNREPLGTNGRVTDRDLEPLKRRLLVRINRALQGGPQVSGVYVRSLQEVPGRTGSR
ncbi:flagellar basal body-associated FliL family protein [Ferrovibrio xuzhouensis]|uniref:Flagellar basal body-associated FliL family protein n=1 Tax=Ferrovibrio xuzhouensis TaxID=1576914 RepID=A0ABV7V9P2_9PROT